MSLFIRVDVGFWSHRKTLRLRTLIGDAAFWLPPRLWAYAAQQQPDGDFTGYMPEEVAMLVGYVGDAKALLDGLRHAGFMDGMQLHDWVEHNGYHKTFSERAKKAAKARWKKKTGNRQEKRGEENRSKQCLEDACSIIPKELDNSEFRRAWTEWAEYRRQAKLKPYTELGAKKQLASLAKMGAIRAILAIDHTIAQGWQGIHEPKGEVNGTNGHQFLTAKEQAHEREAEAHDRINPKLGW